MFSFSYFGCYANVKVGLSDYLLLAVGEKSQIITFSKCVSTMWKGKLPRAGFELGS